MSQPNAEQHKAFADFEELVEWVGHQREGIMHGYLTHDVHLVAFESFQLTLKLLPKAPQNLPQQLQELLKKQRNEEWTIAISDEIGQPTLYEKAQSAREARRQRMLETPLVKQVMDTFPGTTLAKIEEA